MILNEIVKSFLPEPKEKEASSEVKDQNVMVDLGDDLYPNSGSFFDSDVSQSLFGKTEMSDVIFKQKEKIMKYRQVAQTTDVTEGLDEIVNEVIFSYDDKSPLKLFVDEENEKLIEAISEKFEKIKKKMNLKRNLFQIVKRSYIDGQIILHCAYGKNTKEGIQSINMIEPTMLYFDVKSKSYKYMTEERSSIMQANNSEEYSIEEIVREDFGLYDGKINLGYLEYAIKPANMLKTLEDLLVPMRFSRSISRRVFNVDIGDLPSKRGAEVMQEHQNKFKYKKFYNAETGEISNQQHITSMVEDYWFSNRSGGKGTQVATLDESGNLGELDDILYFSKKLYRSLKIPASRISANPDADTDFDYDSGRVTKEDMKFFMFISRIRQVYSSLFKEVLKREVISTGIMSSAEWDEKEEFIEISFSNENKFIEKMNLDNFMAKIDIYSTVSEYQGKLFPIEKILKDVFKMSDEEIKENFKQIQKEEKDPIFANFYNEDDY
jgi:hypothetical protein